MKQKTPYHSKTHDGFWQKRPISILLIFAMLCLVNITQAQNRLNNRISLNSHTLEQAMNEIIAVR